MSCRPRRPSSTPTSGVSSRALADAAHAPSRPGGDAWQDAIFDAAPRATALPPDARSRRSTSRSSAGANGPRAGWLLASLDPDFVVDRLREAGRTRRRRPTRRTVMSVGLQRLRDDADTIRDGAIRKGEDPALVDRALELDAERRRLLAETEALKAERNTASKRIGEAIKGGAAPDGPEVADLRDASTRGRRRGSRRSTRRSPTTEADLDDLLLRIPNPPDPDIPVGGEEANVTIRTWGEPCLRDTTVDGWTRKPHWELGEALDILDNARGAKIAGSGFPVYKGAGSRLQRGADQLVPRRPHARERHDRGLAAGRRQHGQSRTGHRPDPRQGRPDVRRHPRRAVPGPDRRGPGHQPPSRRDPRGRPSCRSATRPTRRASGARPARPARTPAASCASTSSTRSRWSCSRSPRTPRRRSNG